MTKLTPHDGLVGRDAELARLIQLVEDANRSLGCALIVRGDAGIGKTRLLQALATRADARDVLRLSGIEAERNVAFAGLTALFAGHREPAELPTWHSPLDAGLATLGTLSELAVRGTTLVVVDDAHWLDEPSLASLIFASRRLT
jgi:predicted ATPase